MTPNLNDIAAAIALPWSIPAHATYQQRTTIVSLFDFELRRYALGRRQTAPKTKEIIERVMSSKGPTALQEYLYAPNPFWKMVSRGH